MDNKYFFYFIHAPSSQGLCYWFTPPRLRLCIQKGDLFTFHPIGGLQTLCALLSLYKYCICTAHHPFLISQFHLNFNLHSVG